MTGGEIWEERATSAGGRAGAWSCAVAVEEANLAIEAPVAAPRCISTEPLTLSCFCNVIEVANLRLFLTSCILELLTARLCYRWSFWSSDGKAAVRGVFAGGCAGVALGEKEAVAGPVVVGEGGEHEIVAVNVGSTLLLAVKLRLQVKDGSYNVGDWVE